MMEKIVQISGDGSPTIFSQRFGATYHSIHGAATESLHVFIGLGLIPILDSGQKDIRILEIGFGSGLNLLLTIEALKEKDPVRIEYHAIEPFPIGEAMAKDLGLEHSLQFRPDDMNWWYEVHRHHHFKGTIGAQYVDVSMYEKTIEEFSVDLRFDLVYFDAFAPSTQPEMWTPEVFEKVHQLMNPGGSLCTYCAKGDVKRAMRSVGFQVEAHPGPPRKREITRAVKI